MSFDPNLREEVWANPSEIKSTVMKAVALADVVKFSEEELVLLTGSQSVEQGLNAIADFDNTLILVTQGAKGVWRIFEGSGKRVTGQVVQPIDTTGAGDTFTGYVLAGLDRGQPMLQAMQTATKAAALMVMRHGTADVIPDLSEVHSFSG